MADLPGNVSYGTLTGHFVKAVMDTIGDVNTLPDMVAIVGKVFLTPKLSGGFAKDPTQLLTIVPDSYVLDLVNGFIVDASGNPGVQILATDDPDLVPVGWTWTMSFDFTGVTTPKSFDFAMPSGATIDVSTIVPIAVSTGTALGVAESAAAAAATSAAAAAASAAAAAGGGSGVGLDVEAAQDMISTFIIPGTGMTAVYNDAAVPATFTISTIALARANHTGTQSADTITDGTTNKAFLATERTKLTGIATAATANSSDATLLNRANHTGAQATSTVTGLDAKLTSAVKTPVAWVTGTQYAVGDFFSSGTTVFRTVVAHTASATTPTTANARPTDGTSNYEVWSASGNSPSSLVQRSTTNEITAQKVYVLSAPTSDTEAANKLYIDTAVAGVTPPPVPYTMLPVKWSSPNWQYNGSTITARPADARSGDQLHFIGNPGGALPAWAASGDVWSQGGP